jgi:hypothetical protein
MGIADIEIQNPITIKKSRWFWLFGGDHERS